MSFNMATEPNRSENPKCVQVQKPTDGCQMAASRHYCVHVQCYVNTLDRLKWFIVLALVGVIYVCTMTIPKVDKQI